MTYNKDVDTILTLVNKIKGKQPQQKISKVKPVSVPKTSINPGPFQLAEFNFPKYERVADEPQGSEAWMNKGEPPIANMYRNQYSNQTDMAKKRLLEAGEEEDPLIPYDIRLSDADALNIERRGEAFAKDYLRRSNMDRQKLAKRFAVNYVKQEPIKKMLPKSIRTQPIIEKKIEALPEAEVRDAAEAYQELGDKAEKSIKKEDAAIEKIKRARERKRATKEQFDRDVEMLRAAKATDEGSKAEDAQPQTPSKKKSVSEPSTPSSDRKLLVKLEKTLSLITPVKGQKAAKPLIQEAVRAGILKEGTKNVNIQTIKDRVQMEKDRLMQKGGAAK